METNKIKENIDSIIIDMMGCDAEAVKPEANFFEDLGCDSLDLIEMVVNCEREFEIDIDDVHIPMIKTVGDLHKYVICEIKH